VRRGYAFDCIQNRLLTAGDNRFTPKTHLNTSIEITIWLYVFFSQSVLLNVFDNSGFFGGREVRITTLAELFKNLPTMFK
jgi:hypothetical protein